MSCCRSGGITWWKTDTATTVTYAVIWDSQKSDPWSRSSKKLQQWHLAFTQGANVTWSSLQGHQGAWLVSQRSEMTGQGLQARFPWVLVSWWQILSTWELFGAVDFSAAISSFSQWLALADSPHHPVPKQASLLHLKLPLGIRRHFPGSPNSSPPGVANDEIPNLVLTLSPSCSKLVRILWYFTSRCLRFSTVYHWHWETKFLKLRTYGGNIQSWKAYPFK